MSVQSVILAAGLSVRIGKNKMLLPLNGKSVIEHCVLAFYGYCSKIIVVTGKYDEEIRHILKPYDKITCVYNSDYEQGMFTSVKTGIRIVDAKRFFITPGDYPMLKSSTVQTLLKHDGYYVQPAYQGKNGHPILLHETYIPMILGSQCQSLRQCLKTSPHQRQIVDVDDAGVATDMDTVEAYHAALKTC